MRMRTPPGMYIHTRPHLMYTLAGRSTVVAARLLSLTHLVGGGGSEINFDSEKKEENGDSCGGEKHPCVQHGLLWCILDLELAAAYLPAF